MLNGLLNISEFTPSSQSQGIKTGGGEQDFMQIFQSKLKTQENRSQNSFISDRNYKHTGDKNIGNDHKTPKNNDNFYRNPKALYQENKPANENIGCKDAEKIEEFDETIDNDKGLTPAKSLVRKEDLDMDFLLLELDEEETDQYENLISAEILQQLQELLLALSEEGYISQDELEQNLASLAEAPSLKETISLLANIIEENEAFIDDDGQNLENKLEHHEISKFAKAVLREASKHSKNRVHNGEIKLETFENVKQATPVKIQEDLNYSDLDGKESETKDLRQNLSNVEEFSKDFKSKTTNEADEIASYTTIEINKNPNIKLNDIFDKNFDVEKIYGKNLLEELIHKVDGIYKTGKNQLKLQLVPEHLGKLSINLSSDNQNVKARIFVESLQVKETIESNLNAFRDNLREKGVNITNIEVSVGQDPETFRQNRNLMQLKTKARRVQPSFEENILENVELDRIANLNPYLRVTGFDRLG